VSGRRAERAAALVTRWVRRYTRRLPAPVAERRLEEITSDLYDHVSYERARGVSDRRLAWNILSRLFRGLAADLRWRDRIRPWRSDLVKSFPAILAAALALAVVGVLAIRYADADDAPGLGLIGFLLIAGGLVLAVRAALRRRRDAGR